jgi:uncharacterized membrane protein
MCAGRLRAAIAVLSLVGAGIAAYLVYTRYSGESIFCSTGGCETVQSSKYAEVAGIPVAVLGLAGYLGILATAAVRGPTSAAIGVAFAAVGAAFGAYLLYAQLVLIDAVCQWCVASDVLISVLAVACLWRFRRESGAFHSEPVASGR